MSKVIKPTYAIYFAGGMRSRALLAWAKDIFSIFNDDAVVISVATNRTSAKTVQYMEAISEAAGLQFRLLTGCFAMRWRNLMLYSLIVGRNNYYKTF